MNQDITFDYLAIFSLQKRINGLGHTNCKKVYGVVFIGSEKIIFPEVANWETKVKKIHKWQLP